MPRLEILAMASLWVGLGCVRPVGEVEADPGAAAAVDAELAGAAGADLAPGLESASPDAENAPAKGEEEGAGTADGAAGTLESARRDPIVADSKLVAGAWVDEGSAAGLREFTQSFAELHEGGAFWVGPLEGNGGRDVLIFIPPQADPAADFELVFHFHGTYSETVQRREDGMKKKREWVGWDRLEQTCEGIAELSASRAHNVALIYPISAGKRLEPDHQGWSNAAYDRMWMNPAKPPDYRDDFDRLYGESVGVLVDALGVHPSKIREAALVEGHSAGGMAVTHVAARGSSHVGEYLYLDASFMGWADVAHAAMVARGDPARLTMVVRDGGIADPFEGRDPWCPVVEAHAAAWPGQRETCGERGGEHEVEVRDHEGARARVACETLELDAQEWAETEGWCREMADEMRGVPGVTLVRTKVTHGKQPRRFAGGLGLAADRGR